MEYTRSQIRAARQKWIDFQSTKGRRKAKGMLDKGDGNRCCLGHACCALAIDKIKDTDGSYSYGQPDDYSDNQLPEFVAEMLGMWTEEGEIRYDINATEPLTIAEKYPGVWKSRLFQGSDTSYTLINGRYGVDSLVGLNDYTDISAVDIGRYLATVIEGGYGTPFKPLSDYPETI